MLSCFSHVRLFVILSTVAPKALLSVGFSRQEYWSGLSCPPPGDLPNSGIEPHVPYIPCICSQVLYHCCHLGSAKEKVQSQSSVVSDSLQPHGLYSPWNSPGQNTGVGSLVPKDTVICRCNSTSVYCANSGCLYQWNGLIG